MTIKETIGKYQSKQLRNCAIQLARVNASNTIIYQTLDEAEEYRAGKFQIQLLSENKGYAKYGVGTTLMDNPDGSCVGDILVTKVEGAMATGKAAQEYYDIFGILKMTTEDGTVYYYDSDETLSTDISDLASEPVEEFFELEGLV